MYQPQTLEFQMSDDNPNHRKMLKLRLRDSKRGETATPRGAKPDSSRTLRKILARTKASTAAMKLDNAMEAAASRNEVWSTDPKGRKPLDIRPSI